MSRFQKYLDKTPKEKLNSAAVAYLAALDHIEAVHPLIAKSILQELDDQRSYLKLIASENYSSLAVQLAMGNLLTDKYAEGYAFHRFYAGCDNVDIIEDTAQQELKSLFGAEYASVQPHSGADANLLAIWAILVNRIQNPELEKLGKKSIDELNPEEHETLRHHLLSQKVMGLSLNSGGHLTHGYRHNISSKIMKSVLYDVDPKTELLDYKALSDMAKREKPDIIMAGYSAHSRKLNFAKFREIADSVGAVLMADVAHFSGLIAGKAFEGEFNPVPYAQMITSTTHKTLRGPRGGMILCTAELGEIVNKGCPMVMGGPLPHVMAAKAVAFKEANTPEFCIYTKKIIENAQSLSKALIEKGLRIVSGATENHLMVVDITSLGLTGRHAESALRKAGLTINRNAIPFDQNGPWYTSGIRLGTPALTTLGMGASEMTEIADIIVDVLKNTKPSMAKNGQPSKANSETDAGVIAKSKSRVKNLLSKFPLYPEIG